MKYINRQDWLFIMCIFVGFTTCKQKGKRAKVVFFFFCSIPDRVGRVRQAKSGETRLNRVKLALLALYISLVHAGQGAFTPCLVCV